MTPARLTLGQSAPRPRQDVMRALDAAQAILWFDASGDVTWANTNAQALFDYTLADLEGLSLADLTGTGHLDPQETARAHWRDVRSGQRRHETLVVLDRRDRPIRVAFTYAPLGFRGAEGVVALVVPLEAEASSAA